MVQTPEIGQFYRKNRPTERCFAVDRNTTEPQAKALAPGISRPAFLSRAHPPKIGKFLPELRAYARIEREFKTSLSNLCALYDISEPEMGGIFPMNISGAFEKVAEALSNSHGEIKPKIMQDKSGKVCLATQKVFDTRMTLYYLPLCSLWEMMKQKDKKSETALLLSVLSYLFQIAGVPHFAETYSYLDGIYEMVAEWNDEQEQDEVEEPDAEFIAAHFSMMNEAGIILLSQMNSPKNLARFRGRVKRFKPKNAQGKALLNCAKNALQLFRAFPARSVMDNMAIPALESEEDSFIRSEQYMGFYWSNKDCVIDSVMEYVNAELSELCEMEEPVSVQYFDCPQDRESHDFTFEEKFFALLNEITDHLTDLS
ncbi:hypothetical protein ACFOG5_02485 [Pedobacter fastidiosus]|uniref:Uncharacterized protein n=1 Tax=Pedobacter fastidiosus TaxID=2765361 RepID=A0ABR7KXM6_9SPHI|nr:hypothetical protein [Pedobacter fastidiosus]MBC6112448.1 hypothetical protein [Pedobacter fastidiosus]